MDYENENLNFLNLKLNQKENSINISYTEGKVIANGILIADLEFQYSIYTWYVPILFVILGIACIGNIFIISSYTFIKKPLSIYLKLCISLAISDLWAAILIAIGLYVNSYLPSVKGQSLSSLCFNLILEIFRISGMFTSVLHLLALAFGQFLVTLRPIQFHCYATSRRINITIGIMYIFPLFIVAFIFYIFTNNDPSRRCFHNSYSQFPLRISIFCLFSIPLIITFALYGVILYLLLNKRERDLQRHGGSIANRNRENKIKSKLNIVKTTMIILTTFTFSWGICVLYFFLVCKKGCPIIYLVSIDFYTAFVCNTFVNTMVVLKLALNPLIYAFRIEKIRNGIKEIFNRIVRKFFLNIGIYFCPYTFTNISLKNIKCFDKRKTKVININSNEKYKKNNKVLDNQSNKINTIKIGNKNFGNSLTKLSKKTKYLMKQKKNNNSNEVIIHTDMNDFYAIYTVSKNTKMPMIQNLMIDN
ncbi:G protein-coupled receptor, rhodopsin-like family and GPCR, rhodopsin-like, 7TM domain-containing protein [Strongyloides ratti]|uniref:G protein-coupled receptor, rhodopsin-like family and GPCR, rhodopsin-like, 7TM domain-containing protein n=1 Tax=Strongyloides ratti TaxID=34506 RepID=A0A090LP52_STRRB|nr:G protein-coupled receptor, rhodopsin-like family and GPCR, rhodopsin-like, 7TM domain-containing protein [Strongyloides ratti]CEF71541.1 G protein-coupled receptor, rhodopsin-like family and GPCR, rhodopsin-like, 7TM domain-containing protein [Strongyloides ratti]